MAVLSDVPPGGTSGPRRWTGAAAGPVSAETSVCRGGAGAADSAGVWYSTTARTNVPYRLLGYLDLTEATAGTYATAPSVIQGSGGQVRISGASMVRLNTANVYGSTNTSIRRFTTAVNNQGADITYADSATNGGSFTINTPGIYSISYTDQFNTSGIMGISLNSNQLTSSILSITAVNILASNTTQAVNVSGNASWSGFLNAGDVVRAHNAGVPSGTNVNACQFTIVRIS